MRLDKLIVVPFVRGHTGSQNQCGHLGEQRSVSLLPEIDHGFSVAVRLKRQKVILELSVEITRTNP